MWRPLLVLALLLSAFVPFTEAAATDQVAWPADFQEPYREQVRNLGAVLGIEVDYWYANEQLLSSMPETLDHGWTRFESRYDDPSGRLEVTVVRPDATVSRFWVDAERTREEIPGSFRYRCTPEGCNEIPLMDDIVTVRIQDLPVGVTFGPFNMVSVEGPLGMFDRFGKGRDAVLGIASELGIPADRVAWDERHERPLDGHPRTHWWTVPEVDRVPCPCTHVTLPGSGVIGSDRIEVVLLGDRVVRFGSSPWLVEGATPRVSAGAAEAVARAHLAELGYDHWMEWGLTASDHLLRLVLLPPDGLAWRFQVLAQGPDRSAFAELFIDATTGETIVSGVYPTAEGGYAPPIAPPFWAVALVASTAWFLTRRYD